MPIEDALNKLTLAVEKNNTLLESLLAKGAAATKTAEPAAAAAPKPAAEAPKPAAAPKPGPKAKPKFPTEDAIRTSFGNFLSVKDTGERTRRKDLIKPMLEHFGVVKATEIPEESREEAIGYIAQLEAGETPNYMNEGEAAGDGEESLI